MAKHVRLITSLLKQGVKLCFASAMKTIVRELLRIFPCHPLSSFLTEMPLPTPPDHSGHLATPVLMALALLSNKNSWMAQSALLRTLVEVRSKPNGIGLPSISKLAAYSGILNAFEAIYGQQSFPSFSPTNLWKT